MKKFIAYCITIISTNCMSGQTWSNVGSGLSNYCLNLHKHQSNLYAARGGEIYVWNNITWTLMPSQPVSLNTNYTIEDFNDTIYTAGKNSVSSSVPVFKFNGSSWVTTGGVNGLHQGSNPVVYSLLKYGNKLVSAGRFSSINSNSINNIAIWDGIKWDSLGNGLIIAGGSDAVRNLCVHNNTLIASGDFIKSGTDVSLKYIAQWNGSVWKPLSPTHVFKTPGSKPMTSFNNDLIIGNVWDTISSVPMKGIAVWNGTSFSSMGSNLFYNLPGFGGITSFWVFNSTLFCSAFVSSFSVNGYDNVVLMWNGSTWVQVGSDFDSTVLTLSDFNNELFSAGFFTNCGSNPTAFVSKTSVPIGITEYKKESNFKVYPNPASNLLHIESEQYFEEGTEVEITNLLGQVILTLPYSKEVDVSNLSSGCYILKIYDTDKEKRHCKFIKE